MTVLPFKTLLRWGDLQLIFLAQLFGPIAPMVPGMILSGIAVASLRFDVGIPLGYVFQGILCAETLKSMWFPALMVAQDHRQRAGDALRVSARVIWRNALGVFVARLVFQFVASVLFGGMVVLLAVMAMLSAPVDLAARLLMLGLPARRLGGGDDRGRLLAGGLVTPIFTRTCLGAVGCWNTTRIRDPGAADASDSSHERPFTIPQFTAAPHLAADFGRLPPPARSPRARPGFYTPALSAAPASASTLLGPPRVGPGSRALGCGGTCCALARGGRRRRRPVLQPDRCPRLPRPPCLVAGRHRRGGRHRARVCRA
ncbi:MAG: hypothetical protein R3F11_06685 [Verrucomicrobiales bacterium]